MNIIRLDTHRPSAINPAEYDFVGYEYLPRAGDPLSDALFIADERARIRAHMARTGGTYSNHEHGGNCHICGSVNAIYTALFYHRPTNVYIRTGLDCAAKLEASVTGEEFRAKIRNALEAKAGKRKALAILERGGVAKAWEIYEADPATLPRDANGMRNEELTVRDIVGKLVKYGSISDKAMRYVYVLVKRIENRAEYEAKRAADAAAAAPVPVADGRIKITGKVLSTKVVDTRFGRTLKMLVVHDTGFKVWGTVPTAIDVERGDRVEFEAAVTPSNDDPKFGFFSRPTKARVIAEAVKEAA